MKPLRAHDYFPRPEFPPAGDFRGLRRILAMFIIGIAVSAAICATLIICEATRPRPVPHATTACTCMGACLRH
jgi:hypothetical protein